MPASGFRYYLFQNSPQHFLKYLIKLVLFSAQLRHVKSYKFIVLPKYVIEYFSTPKVYCMSKVDFHWSFQK